MERVLDLTLKLADEGLSPLEQEELEHLIEAEPLARRRHLQMLEVEAALRSARHTKSPGKLLIGPASPAEERRVAGVLATIRKPPRLLSWRRGARLRTGALVASMALAAAAALVIWNPVRPRPAGKAGVMGRAATRAPSTRHEQPTPSGRRGWSVAVLPVQAVPPGDHVELDLGDSATLEVRGRAVLGIERAALAAEDGTASRVTLEEGTVAYRRSGREAAQTAISTPHADVLVRAGRALVTVTAEDTRVTVLDGQATLALRTEERTQVGARHAAVIARGRAIVSPLPSALLVVGHAPARVPEQFLDQVLARRLEALGFATDVSGERELRVEQVQHRGLVVISPTVSGQMHDRVQELALFNAPVPILCSRPSLYQDLGMAAPGRANGEFSKGKKTVRIEEHAHPLAAGLRGQVEVLDATMTIGWGVPAASATRIASMRDKPERAAIFAYERDAPLLAPAGRAAARRTGFFLHATSVRFMNDQAWSLFDAAVKWTAGDAAE
jgi:hypothetical protein